MIDIQIDDREVRAALDRLQRRLGDLTPVMHDIGEALLEATRQGIEHNRDWHGRPFAPNSPATLRKKRGDRPLMDTRSFVSSRLYYEAGRDSVILGSSAVQAAVLQFGAKRGSLGKTKRGRPIPWGDIPPRPYLPIEDGNRLPDSARTLIIDLLREALESAASQHR